jgi:hypothetical protein
MFYRYPKIRLPEYFLGIYKKITTDDLQTVAEKIFDFDKINISVLQTLDTVQKQKYENTLNKYISAYKDK